MQDIDTDPDKDTRWYFRDIALTFDDNEYPYITAAQDKLEALSQFTKMWNQMMANTSESSPLYGDITTELITTNELILDALLSRNDVPEIYKQRIRDRLNKE